jgi:hypothetical protein
MLNTQIAIAENNSAQLLELARKKFKQFTNQDKVLFQAVANGDVLDSGPAHDLETKADGSDRSIQADRISWLCSERGALEHITHKGIQIKGARIKGKLDLSWIDFPYRISCKECVFDEEIKLRYANVGTLDLAGSQTRTIDATGMKSDGNVFFTDGFKTRGKITLLGAKIGGSLWFYDGEIVNPGGKALVADAMHVSGDLFLGSGAGFKQKFKAVGEVRLVDVKVGGQLSGVRGHFFNPGKDALQAAGLHVNRSLHLGNGFKAEGRVLLSGAYVGRNFICKGGQFINPQGVALSAYQLKVDGGISFSKGKDRFEDDGFKAEGEVILRRATIGGDWDSSGGRFINPEKVAIDARFARVGGGVWFNDKLRVEGSVMLLGSEIADDLNLDDAAFINPDGNALDLQRAQISETFEMRFLDVKGDVNLRSLQVGALLDDPNNLPKGVKLDLDGFVYKRFSKDAPTDLDTRVKWIRRSSQHFYSPRPYEQLAKYYRESGNENASTKILVAKENDRALYGRLSLNETVWHRIKKWVIGYGYVPLRALWWIVLTILVGWGLFGKYANLIQARREHPQKLSPFMYSVDAFIPIINFHQVEDWLPRPEAGEPIDLKVFAVRPGSLLRMYLWIHTALGWILTGFLAAAVSGLVQR